MTINMCSTTLTGMGKFRKAQCRLRHDVVHCKPCRCFVLHSKLQKHRRAKDHRFKCDGGVWKADTRRPTPATIQSPYSYVPSLKSLEKLVRRLAGSNKVAGSANILARRNVGQHLFVSGNEILNFKSEVGTGTSNDKKTEDDSSYHPENCGQRRFVTG